jgi:YjbE family integral membrane protein
LFYPYRSGRFYQPLVKERQAMDWEWILDWIKIVIIDLTLAGDNAVMIAMAVRTLPPRQRQLGILWGAVGAVVIRIFITFVAAQILHLPLFQLVGGILLIWIAFKLLREDSGEETKGKQATTLWEAITIIIVADLIMSIDNILAVAGASEGNALLLIFGLGLSIPIVVMGATFIATLLGRYSWLVFLGAGILGEVAGKMAIDDQYISQTFGVAPKPVEWGLRLALAGLIVLGGLYLARKPQPAPDVNVSG